MSGNTRANSQLMILTEEWQTELEEILFEELLQLAFYRTIQFPQAKQLVLPSMGTPEVRSYQEEGVFTYDTVDQGQTIITVNDLVYCGNSFTQCLQEDSILVSQEIAAVPGLHAQAIKERLLTDLLALANHQFGGVGNANVINGANHRFVATGTSGAMDVKDFAYAAYALRKAKVPTNNLIAIVDPSVGYTMDTLANIANVSNNPRWEGIIATGIQNQMRFIRNIYGFDVYESNFLPPAPSETIGSASTTAKGVANVFFSMSNPRLLPFMFAEKRAPKVKSEIDFDTDDTLKIVTTARWGTGLSRDENLVTILSNTL